MAAKRGSRLRPLGAGLGLLVAAASCGDALDGAVPGNAADGPRLGKVGSALTQSIVYVGKQSITDFTGLGQHLQYWPGFGRTSPQTARRTDDEACIELTPDFDDFKHHYLLPGRTFSNDALGDPIGTKTRGGYAAWPTFKLPDGRVGRSGTFYDESNVGNSNNTVNEMKISSSSLSEFCLNLVTDNTGGEHDANVILEARSDNVDLSLAGHPDLTFDGKPDMYTFRYQGMKQGDVVKIRFQCSAASGCKGAGLGGIMVSNIATCTGKGGGVDAGPTAPDASAPPSGPSNTSSGATSSGATSDVGPTTNGSTAPSTEGASGGCRTAGARRDASASFPAFAVVAAAGVLLRRRRRAGRM